MSMTIHPTSYISKTAKIGHGCHIGPYTLIDDDVSIGDNTFIDAYTIIRKHVTIGENSFIGANCIIGEYWNKFCVSRIENNHPLIIGHNALIRSGTIIYAGSVIGDNFQTGHRVCIREESMIGSHVSIGTFSDIQGNCVIGNYVRMHSSTYVSKKSKIDSFVWIFPHVKFTNDKTPPSEDLAGIHIKPFVCIGTGSILLPGIEIEQDALIGSGAVVTKNVKAYTVMVGNPARVLADIRTLKNKKTEKEKKGGAYPWRYFFNRYMPWEKIGFKTWFNTLTPTEKEFYQIHKLQE